MAEQPGTIVWITGATSGIGAAYAKTCPWDAQIISVSRRPHPDHETVPFDLTDMASWDAVGEDFTRRLASFRGQRAVFVHNALHDVGRAFAGEGDPAKQREDVVANVMAPLVLGDMFLRAARPAVDAGVDVGLVQVSSAAAKLVYPGMAVYGAGKSAMEQWVRGVRSERRHRGKGPWVIAVRPGFVDTPATRREAAMSVEDNPGAPDIAKALDDGFALQPEDSARQLWAALPPAADSRTVLFIGEAVAPRT